MSLPLHLPTAVRNSLPHGDRALPFINTVDCALVRLLESNGNPEDTTILGSALNLTAIRLHSIGNSEAGVDLIERAGVVLMELDFHRGGRSLASFTREEQQLLIDAVDLYATVMRESSPEQMERAKVECTRAIRAQQWRIRRA